AALLEAFRAQTSNRLARRLPVESKSWPRWALAAAAAILIVFGFIIYRAIRNEPQKTDNSITRETPALQPLVKHEEQVVKGNGEPDPRRGPRAPRPRRGNRSRLNKPFIIDSMTFYAKDSEYATDFFPLTYGGDQKPIERVEVIRVQMPRSA